jgi:flagellar basal-body rod protein FlgG
MEPPIQIPVDASQVQITPDGKIMMTPAGSSQQSQIGQIELSRFVNPAGLQAMGSNLFVSTAASGDPIEGIPGSIGFPTLQQGALEQSNVDVTVEMVNLIVAQRAFELNSRAVSTVDNMMGTVTNMKQFP